MKNFFFGYGNNSKQGLKVACAGDSITEGPGRKHPDSYPMQLQGILGKAFRVKNFGVSSTTLLKKGDFPYWQEGQFQRARQFKPDILIIKLGTNDSKPENWGYKDSFVADYVSLIGEFKDSMPADGKIFICLPAPVFEDNYGIREAVLVDEMAPMIKEVATKTGVQVIDLHAPLKNSAHQFPDGVHPDKNGAGSMAKIVMESIMIPDIPYTMG